MKERKTYSFTAWDPEIFDSIFYKFEGYLEDIKKEKSGGGWFEFTNVNVSDIEGKFIKHEEQMFFIYPENTPTNVTLINSGGKSRKSKRRRNKKQLKDAKRNLRDDAIENQSNYLFLILT